MYVVDMIDNTSILRINIYTFKVTNMILKSREIES